MEEKEEQRKSWKHGFGACFAEIGSMHQNVDGCEDCEYCRDLEPDDE